METLTRNQEQTLLAKVKECLGAGIDTPKLDDLVAQMLQVVGESTNVACRLVDDSTIGVKLNGQKLHAEAIPRARAKFRMLCARFAVLCSKWSNQEVSPYGAILEFEHPQSKQRFKARFENTTGCQELEIEVVPQPKANGPFEARRRG